MWLDISHIYYTQSTSDVWVMEINVATWPSGDSSNATWLGGYDTGRIIGGRPAEGYVIEIKFTPANRRLQSRLHNYLQVIGEFVHDLGNDIDTISRIRFAKEPNRNVVKKIHRDAIIKITKLLKKDYGYLVECDSPFLSHEEFMENTPITPSDIKELEAIKEQKEREEDERQRQLEAEARERAAEERKRIAELMTLDEAARREAKSRERAAIAMEREAEAVERKAEAAQREAEAQRQAADSAEREAVARERVVEAARREKPTMPKGWSPETKKPKKKTLPKKKSSDPIGTSRSNREQLREAGRKRIEAEKKADKKTKPTYEKKQRRRQSSGGGKKAIIIGIPVLVVFVVLFSGMNQGDVIEISPATVQDLKCSLSKISHENNNFKVQLSGFRGSSCWFYDDTIGSAKLTGINNYSKPIAVIIQDKNQDYKCIKKIPLGVFSEYIPVHKYAKYGINTIFLSVTTNANAPNSGYYEGAAHKCWIKDNMSFGTIEFGRSDL